MRTKPIETYDVTCRRCATTKNPFRGPDPCLGYLPGVDFACCGHGRNANAYVSLKEGSVFRGQAAVNMIKILKLMKNGSNSNMSVIIKPMLAATLKDVEQLDYTKKYLATQKLDGIRALMINGKLVSRTFKPIRNVHIRTTLEVVLPEGADGEIVCPGAFQATSSGVMRADGEPEFVYYMFDYVKDTITKAYEDRIGDMVQWHTRTPGLDKIQLLVPIEIKDYEHLKEFEAKCINDGFEGAILRTPDGPYKCGRSTAKQEWLLKLKRFADDEAIIIGFTEKMHNDNEATKDAFGHTVRSSHKDNKRPAGTLGSLVVRDCKTEIEFEIGTGFNDEKRQEIWDAQSKWRGLIIKYKHFAISGVKEKPRFPVFLGVRDKADM